MRIHVTFLQGNIFIGISSGFSVAILWLPLKGESGDGEDGGIGRCFRSQSSNDTESLTENIWPFEPSQVHFLGESGDEEEKVRDGETE